MMEVDQTTLSQCWPVEGVYNYQTLSGMCAVAYLP